MTADSKEATGEQVTRQRRQELLEVGDSTSLHNSFGRSEACFNEWPQEEVESSETRELSNTGDVAIEQTQGGEIKIPAVITLLMALLLFLVMLNAGSAGVLVALILGGLALAIYLIYKLSVNSSSAQRQNVIQQYEKEREQILLRTHFQNSELQAATKVHVEAIDEAHDQLKSNAMLDFLADEEKLKQLLATADRLQREMIGNFTDRQEIED